MDNLALPDGDDRAAGLAGLEWLEDGARPLDWNGPTRRVFTRFRGQDLDRPIIELFERMVRRDPDCVAIKDADASLSFAQVWSGLSGLAQTIAADTAPGDLVAILLPACPMFPLAMLACLAAGRPFLPLDANYPHEWARHVLQDARPTVIVGHEDALDGVLKGAPKTRVIHLDRLPPPAREGWRPDPLGPDQPACVLFTSGSTGRPKGIVNSQRALLQRVAQSINAGHIDADDRFLTLASLGAVVGVRDALTGLLAGGCVHLLDAERVGVRKILDVIRDEAITVLFAFPALLRSVAASSGERAGEALRLVRVGGDTTLWSDFDLLRGWLEPQAAIQSVYAATEAPMMQWFVDGKCRSDDPRVPVGYPLHGNRLAVIDENGRPTPPGEIGELVVASPYVALGVWSDGALRPDEALRADDGGGDDKPSRRLFRTGDLVRQRPDGLLERHGRKDRQVKIRGVRVELDGVEAALRQHRHVRDAGALVRKGADGDATLVAYLTPQDGAPESLLDEVREMMRAAPPAMRPGRLYLADEIPRLPGSKLDLRALAALDEARIESDHARAAAAAGPGPAEGDRVARKVARVWRDVLQTPVGGPDDDFFDVGGDSLKAITFVLGLEEALGLQLSLTLVNEAPTFAALCEALRQRRANRYVALVLLKAGETLPPVFFIHGVGGNVAELFPMARGMTYAGPVIGIQARGLGPEETPHSSVEAMAAEYLRAIKARQPGGPYYLCGYSFGGLVAFEMARRLHEAGDEVGLVGLFDTTTSPLAWPLQNWPTAIRNAGRAAWGGLRGRATPTALYGAAMPDLAKSAPAAVLKVTASALIASARYRPGFYPGELKLFTPQGRDPALPAPEAIWRRHAGALSIIDTAGAHLTMLSAPNAESTAASLTRCLPAG